MTRPINRLVVAGLLAAVVLAPCAEARAQSLSDRIDHYHKSKQSKQSKLDKQAKSEQAQLRITLRRLSRTIGPVDLEDVTARDAFAWWSRTSGVQLLVNWKKMANDGVDPETPIRLKLRSVGVVAVLKMIMEQTAQDVQPLIFEVKPWYVQVITRQEALRHPVTKVYYIGDLLIQIPNFKGAPSLGLGGSSDDDDDDSGGSGRGDDDDDDDADSGRLSATESADQIVQLIRDTVEPDIWVANGGEFATISHFQQRLVVRAPMFVQRQIGDATSPGTAQRRATTTRSGVVRRRPTGVGKKPMPNRGAQNGVSGIQTVKSAPVSGVQGKR